MKIKESSAPLYGVAIYKPNLVDPNEIWFATAGTNRVFYFFFLKFFFYSYFKYILKYLCLLRLMFMNLIIQLSKLESLIAM